MDLLARREHSCLELQQKLQKRVANFDQLQTELDQLVDENLLSDERFCDTFVRSRMNRGYGPLRIKAELKARGVAEQLISGSLHEQADSWLTQLTELVARKYGTEPAQDVKSLAKRQRFLQQRGYTFDQIRLVLKGVD